MTSDTNPIALSIALKASSAHRNDGNIGREPQEYPLPNHKDRTSATRHMEKGVPTDLKPLALSIAFTASGAHRNEYVAGGLTS